MNLEKKFKTGGLVPFDKKNKSAVIHNGCCLVSRSQYDRLGADLIRKLNGCPDSEILVVDDEKLKNMTASEKMQLLLECA